MYTILLGQTGRCKCQVSLRPVEIVPQVLVFITPGQFIQYESCSSDFQADFVQLHPDFVASLGLPYNFEISRLIASEPLFVLLPREYDAAMGYIHMVEDTIRSSPRFQTEILKHLTCAYIFAFSNIIMERSPDTPPSIKEVLMRRFFNLLDQHFSESRSVEFYADKLGVTPQYLTTVSRQLTGKSSRALIAAHLMLEAKVLLSTTELTVQEISNRLNFPNQSFFGKYFKKESGISPSEYRKKL